MVAVRPGVLVHISHPMSTLAPAAIPGSPLPVADVRSALPRRDGGDAAASCLNTLRGRWAARPHGFPQQWFRQPLTRQPASPRKPGPVSMMTTRPRPGLAILAQGWKLAQAPRTGWLWKPHSICTELQCCSGKKNSAGDPLSHSSGMRGTSMRFGRFVVRAGSCALTVSAAA